MDDIALSIQLVFNIVIKAVINSIKATSVVILERQCCGFMCGIALCDGLDFTGGDVRPARGPGFTGGEVGKRLCFQTIITGIIGEISL